MADAPKAVVRYYGYRANAVQWALACFLLWLGNPWRYEENLCRWTMWPHRVLLGQMVDG